MTQQDIINQYSLTDSEVGILNFNYGNAWLSNPSMYITIMRRENRHYECGECGCTISAREYEDYRMCQRCHDYYYNR